MGCILDEIPTHIGTEIEKIECVCYVNGRLWAFASVEGIFCLCSLNKISFEVEDIIPAPMENCNKIRYIQMIEFEQKIFFIPHSSNFLIIFDTDRREWKSYKISDCPSENKTFYVINGAKFSNAFVFERKIFMMPNRYPAIVVFDIASENLIYLPDEIESMIYITKQRECSIAKKYFFQANKIKFFCCLDSTVKEFDIQKTKLKSIAKIERKYPANMQPEFDGECLWLFPQQEGTPIIKICENGGVEEIQYNRPDDYRCWSYSYNLSLYADGKIWLIPGMADTVLNFIPETFELKIVRNWKLLYRRKSDEIQWKYLFATKIDDMIIGFDGSCGRMSIFSLQDEKIEHKKLEIRDKQHTKLEIEFLLYLTRTDFSLRE